MRRSFWWRILTFAVLVSMVAGVVAGCATPTPAPTEAPAPAEAPEADEPEAAPEAEEEEEAEACAGPTIEKLKSAGKVRVGVAVTNPFHMQNPETGEVYGVMVEYQKKLEEHLGIPVEMVMSDWGVLVADLQANKIDMVTAALFATPERKEVIDFTDPLYEMGFGYLVMEDNDKINTIEDLNSSDVTIACLTGTGSEQVTMDLFPEAKILSMVSPGAVTLLDDVRSGRADATHLDSIMVNAYLEEFDDIKAVPADAFDTGGIGATEVAWGIRQGEDDLKSCLNDFIAQIKADGFVDEIMAKYSTSEYLKPVSVEEEEEEAEACAGPTIEKLKSAGKVRVGVAVTNPFHMQNPETGEVYGVMVEYQKKLEEHLGIPVEMVMSDWGVLVADLQANKIDMVTAALFATPERKEVIDFTDPLYEMGFGYLVMEDNDKINTIEDLNSSDVTIACLTGTGSEQVTMDLFPEAKILSMVSPGAVTLLDDVRSGRADATHLDSIMVNAYLEEFDDIKAVPADAFDTGGIGATEVAWGIRQGEDDLKSCLNDFIAQIKADGFVDEIMAKYSTSEYLKPQS